MKNWLDREFGPALANTSVPRAFDSFTGSSGMVSFDHLAFTAGSPLMPNWATKSGTTRKKRTSVK